jgi:hypothetical protein
MKMFIGIAYGWIETSKTRRNGCDKAAEKNAGRNTERPDRFLETCQVFQVLMTD